MAIHRSSRLSQHPIVHLPPRCLLFRHCHCPFSPLSAVGARLLKNHAPWGAAGGLLAIWFTYPAWRETFKAKVIPGYAAFYGIKLDEGKK
jgi:hypothetical protein